MTSQMLHNRWTWWHVLGVVVMAGFGIAATFQAWADIYGIARVDEEYSHIFLVPLIAFWLVWVRRMRFRHCSPTGTIVGPLFIALGWLIASWGFYGGIQSFWHGGSVLVVVGCILSVAGKNVLFRFFPAFLVLIFLIPVPGMIRQRIALPLQTQTAQIAHTVFEIGGVPSDRSGNLLIINDRAVTIAEACNGIRGFFSLILVVFAFCFSMPLRNSVRFLLLLLSPVAALLVNVIRILPTAWLFGYSSESLAMQFHDYAGWVMLPVAFLLLYGIIKLLRWAMIPVTRYTLASS